MTLYTAIIGDYDYLKPLLQPQSEPWNFVCFTDQPEDSPVFDLYREQPDHLKVWKIIRVPVREEGPAKTARYYKIMFHNHIEDEVSIWIDGTFFVNTDLRLWMLDNFKGDFTTVYHPFDDCAYTDAFSCMNSGRGDKWELINQINSYRQEGLPENNGLISSGVLMRRRTKPVIEACELWWDHVRRYSTRDQVAFGYVNWKMPDVHRLIKWDYTIQREFHHCPHRHKRWASQKAREIAGL